MVKHSKVSPLAGLLVALVSFGAFGCKKEEPEPEVPAVPEIPTFKGIAAGYVTEEGLRLEWFAAADLQTSTEDLFYTAYAGVNGGPVDLATPISVSLPGADSMVIAGLEPADYRFVVRVTDSDGNEDENDSAVRVSLLDSQPPQFEGVVGALPLDASRLLIEWKDASDDVSGAHEIRYLIYTSNRAAGVFLEEPVAETTPGATSYVLDLKEAESLLWLGVRAVDSAGNEEQNERATSTLTPESEPPVFFGLAGATATPEGVSLTWTTAVDNATSAGDLVYAVYASKQSGKQDLTRPYLVTEPGVGQVMVEGLDPDTEYFFIARAIDAGNNVDDNTTQVSVTTLPADETPPMFAGVSSLVSQTPTSVTVGWAVAQDSISSTDSLRYEVYLATESGGQVFESPTFVTPPGRTSAELINLLPETTYFVVVRPRDRAGNTDSSMVELSATTGSPSADLTDPQLAGAVNVTRVPSDPTLLLVSWAGAADDSAGEDEIRGHVCVGPSSSACLASAFFDNYNTSSEWGANSAFISGLDPRTTYFAGVRLEDVSGNLQSSTKGSEGGTATSFARNVKPILDSRCNRCHTYTYGTIVNIVEDIYTDATFGELFLVDPGKPVESYLIRKLRGKDSMVDPFSMEAPSAYYGQRMPSDGSGYLSTEREQILIDWITQGAFSN